MPKCVKCNAFFPPDFVDEVPKHPEDKMCIFCMNNIGEIRYGKNKSLRATRQDIIEEYKKFMRMLREKQDILKDTAHGKSDKIPKKLVI
jgi:hypothetical protein